MDIDKDSRGREHKSYKQIIREQNVLQNYMVKCKCSHTLLFTGHKDRLCCSHCGNYVYKDKKTEMRYKVKELLK